MLILNIDNKVYINYWLFISIMYLNNKCFLLIKWIIWFYMLMSIWYISCVFISVEMLLVLEVVINVDEFIWIIKMNWLNVLIVCICNI